MQEVFFCRLVTDDVSNNYWKSQRCSYLFRLDLEFHLQQCFGEIENGVFFRTGHSVFFSFEALGGFNCQIAQTKLPVKKKSSSHFQLDLLFFETVIAFSRIFPVFLRTALLIRIDPRCISELLVDISATIEQCISVIAPARAFVKNKFIHLVLFCYCIYIIYIYSSHL